MPAPLPLGDAIARVEAYARLGSVTAAAKELGIHRTTMRTWIERNGIARPSVRAWTTGDVRNLRQWWSAGITAPEIAKRLGRSKDAVLVKARALRLAKRCAPKWTPAQDAIAQRELDRCVDHLCARLGRSRGGIVTRLARLLMRHYRVAKRRPIADLGGMRIAS